MKTNHQKITFYVTVQYQKKKKHKKKIEKGKRKKSNVHMLTIDTHLITRRVSSSLKKKDEFQVLQKSNCLYDYVLQYRADLTFFVYSAGD